MLIFGTQIGMQRQVLWYGALSYCLVFSIRRVVTLSGAGIVQLRPHFFWGGGGRDQGQKV